MFPQASWFYYILLSFFSSLEERLHLHLFVSYTLGFGSKILSEENKVQRGNTGPRIRRNSGVIGWSVVYTLIERYLNLHSAELARSSLERECSVALQIEGEPELD